MPYLDAKALEDDPAGMAALKAAITCSQPHEPQVVVIPAARPRSRSTLARGLFGFGTSSLRMPLRRAVGAL